MDGDARVEAKDEATMALERASSLIPESPMMLGVLVEFDWLEIDITLGVEDRRGVATAPWFLVEPRDGGTRGGSFGLRCSGGIEEVLGPKER